VRKWLKQLRKAFSADVEYTPAPGSLIHGAALVIEDLDLSKIGLYNQIQKDDLVAAGAPEDDFILGEETGMGRWGCGYWARKSDEGVKRHTFYDTDLKLHKDLKKK
jgi:hypothetical protein